MWLQEKVERGDIRVTKVATDKNWGGVGTKYLSRQRFQDLCDGMGFRWEDGRNSATPQVAEDVAMIAAEGGRKGPSK